jgi:uncharacterized protein (TIGR02453 family)
MEFNGYPKNAVGFLRKLEKNNTREWFNEHKKDYQDLLRNPTEDLIHALRDKLSKKMPEFMFEPKKSIFRIHRDTRFSDNKKPYKNNIAFFVRPKLFQKGVDSPGFYFSIDPKEIYIGGGQYIPSSQDLLRIRDRVNQDPNSLKKILKNPKFKKAYNGFEGKKLSRAPKGYSPDHPDIEILKLKEWFVGRPLDKDLIYSKKLVDVVVNDIVTLSPLVYWIMDTIRYKAFLLADRNSTI